MKFVVDQDKCVGCLACARVCPTRAIAVPAEVSTVSILDDLCIRCGLCIPACPHDAIDALGALETALRLTGRPDAVLIVGTEAPAWFYPATAEQVLNACYAAGFRAVSRGVAGDELVAAEYELLWGAEGWGTMIRSTDPVAVGAIVMRHPELVPYLAPIVTPPVAEARYLRRLYGPDLKVVYAGVWPLDGERELDAVITFEDLSELFRRKSVDVQAQPMTFTRVPMERRRYRSVAGGLPLAWVDGESGGGGGEAGTARRGVRPGCTGSGGSRGSTPWPGRWRGTGSTWGLWTCCPARGSWITRLRDPRPSCTGGAPW